MKLENYKNIVQGVTQEHLDNDAEVELYSVYGGMTCWKGKLSDVKDLIKNEEDREVNIDYYITVYNN